MKTYSELTKKQIEKNTAKFDKSEKEMAVIELLNLSIDEWGDVKASTYNEDLIEYVNEEYLVLTDDEADNAWDESLENFIEECILPELPEIYQGYFDGEAFKHDASYDGRGHSLSSYDGSEEEVNGFYIYRQN